jgi:hypothetical protein
MKTLVIPTEPVKFSNACTVDPIVQLANHADTDIDMTVYLPSKNINLQRDLVWTYEQKSAFILSVLQHKPMPALAINYKFDRGLPMEIIDGKQRLSTLLDFYKGLIDITVNDESYFCYELSHSQQRDIKLFSFNANYHYEYEKQPDTWLTDDDKIAWFLYVNTLGTPMQDEHIRTLTMLKNT